MNINLKATNMELTNAVLEYVEKKLTAVKDKLIDPNDESASCDVEVGKTTKHHKSGDVYKAEFNLHIAGKDLYVVAETDNLYSAIDEAKDELERSLRRHKNKQHTLLLKGGSKVKNFLRQFKW